METTSSSIARACALVNHFSLPMNSSNFLSVVYAIGQLFDPTYKKKLNSSQPLSLINTFLNIKFALKHRQFYLSLSRYRQTCHISSICDFQNF